MRHLSWDDVWDFVEEPGVDDETAQHLHQCQVCAGKLERVRIAQAAIRQTLQNSVATTTRETVERPLHLSDDPQIAASLRAPSARKGKRGLGWSLGGAGMAVAAVVGLVVGLHAGRTGWMAGTAGTATSLTVASSTESTAHEALAPTAKGTSGASSTSAASGTSVDAGTSIASAQVHSAAPDVANGPAQVNNAPTQSTAPAANLQQLPMANNAMQGAQTQVQKLQIDVKDETGSPLGQAAVAVFRGDQLLGLGTTNAQGPALIFDIGSGKGGQVLPIAGLDMSGPYAISLTIVVCKTGYQPLAVFGVGFASSSNPRVVPLTLRKLASGTADPLPVQIVHYGGATNLAGAAKDASLLVEWLEENLIN
ncbi:MAG: hypothetical protein A2201_00845 [Alicyclobacillus sp. RIFOXYA1_FULL_53_8]|nr:MAG: hypothetical protein A2201_00845 [Alicyclobacillus sp. RIFOXYA1_FULL_53_8]